MSNTHQPSLFESPDIGKLAPGLSPSEEYELLFPKSVQMPRLESSYDPNSREADRKRQQGIGGGIVAALNGDITFAAHDAIDLGHTLDRCPSVAGTNQHLFELPGVGKGRTNWYNQPVSDKEIKAAHKGMKPEEVEAQRDLNTQQVNIIRRQMGWDT